MKTNLPQAFTKIPIAHRGLHQREMACPENSLFAARRAVNAGYAIEIDLQLSGDEQAIVFHDYTLDRMTSGKGYLIDHDAAELQDLQLNGSAERIPTLNSLLNLVDGRVPLLIELKDQSRKCSATGGALERATAEALGRYNGIVAVMSFNPHCIAHMCRFAPHISRGLTTDTVGKDGNASAVSDPLKLYESLGASFISHNVLDLTSDLILEFKTKSDPLLCWTVHSEKQEKRARLVADNVTFESYLPKFP